MFQRHICKENYDCLSHLNVGFASVKHLELKQELMCLLFHYLIFSRETCAPFTDVKTSKGEKRTHTNNGKK